MGIYNEENAKTNALVENVYLQRSRKEISWEDLVHGYMRRWNLTESNITIYLFDMVDNRRGMDIPT